MPVSALMSITNTLDPMLHNEFFVLLTGLHFITPCESFLLTIPKIPITSPIHKMQQLNGHCDCAGLSECFCRVLSQLWSSAVVTGVGSRFYFFLPRLSLPLYSNQNKNRAPNGDSWKSHLDKIASHDDYIVRGKGMSPDIQITR